MKKIVILFYILFAILFAYVFLMFIIGIFRHQNKVEVKPSSNEEIIESYPKYFYNDSCFLNQLAEAFIETNHKGYLGYHLHGRNPHHLYETVFKNPTYKLLRCQGWTAEDFLKGNDMTETYPKIREIIKNQFPDAHYCYYGFDYAYHVVFIRRAYVLNKNGNEIFFVYSNNIINIKKLFPEYKFYDKSIPEENDCWIYNFEKNWFICSPNYNFCITR